MSHVDLDSDIDLALKQLRKHGFKITKKRKEILEIFNRNKRYMNAKTIHEELTKNYPTMSYNTTYRNIYDFVNTGILEATEYNGEQYFRKNCLENGHHHHHFICTNCGMAIPLKVCPMELNIVEKAIEGLDVQSHRFEIFGLCQDCREN